MSLSVLLLLALQWLQVLSQRTADMYDICYGKGSVCDGYIKATCSLDSNNPKNWYRCICGTQLPLQQSCDECRYEYASTIYTVDNWYWTSICSTQSVTIGTIPVEAAVSFAAYTQTISLAKSRTFDSASMLSSQRARATATTRPPIVTSCLGCEWFTSTYGGGGAGQQPFVPAETAPPSVEDNGAGESGAEGARGRRADIVGLALVVTCAGAALLW